MIRCEYKNMIVNSDGSVGYFFGFNMRRRWKEVSKDEYHKSSLPVLIIDSSNKIKNRVDRNKKKLGKMKNKDKLKLVIMIIITVALFCVAGYMFGYFQRSVWCQEVINRVGRLILESK